MAMFRLTHRGHAHLVGAEHRIGEHGHEADVRRIAAHADLGGLWGAAIPVGSTMYHAPPPGTVGSATKTSATAWKSCGSRRGITAYIARRDRRGAGEGDHDMGGAADAATLN